jgi:hydroxymethylbilane synthase
MTQSTLRLATRGSALALRQTSEVQSALESRRRPVELVEVETRGDQVRDELIHRLGKTGAFVRALDEEILSGDVDAAVHSMKDMPTEFPAELVVAGVPERAAAGDVLVTPDGSPLEELPAGATVGTSSLRRQAELLAERPDLEVRPLRGNVDTRCEKLLAPSVQADHERRLEAEEGESEESFDRSVDEWFDDLTELERRALEREVDVEFDAIVLAEAGLTRSGLDHSVAFERLPPETFVPAPGQGALAVTALEGSVAERIRESIDHPPTRVRTTVERTILAELNGGCVAPIGVHARLQGAHVAVTVRVLSRDGSEEVTATRDLPVERHPQAARDLAADLREEGAAALVAQAREAETEEADETDGRDRPADREARREG